MENTATNTEQHEAERRLDEAYDQVKDSDDFERFQQNGGLSDDERQEVNSLEQDIKQAQEERQKNLGQSRDNEQGIER